LISRTTGRFRRAFAALPSEVQWRARSAYALFRANPKHPGLRFKRVHATRAVYSVRVGLAYRALGMLEGETVIWFWIGTHADYERLLEEL